jgi:hypothetical protein
VRCELGRSLLDALGVDADEGEVAGVDDDGGPVDEPLVGHGSDLEEVAVLLELDA